MTANEVRGLLPNWKPLTLHLSDGRALRVRNQEYILFSPVDSSGPGTIFVFAEPPAKGFQIVDPTQIVSLERESV